MHKFKLIAAFFAVTLSLNAAAESNQTNLALAGCKFFNISSERPCVLKSNADMSEWQYSDKVTHIPEDMKFVINKFVTCTDTTCLSVGGFNRYTNPAYDPFVLRSEDNGLSWDMLDVTPVDAADAGLGFINCDNTQCIAMGSYKSLKNKRRPFILTSRDQFKTWQDVRTIANLDPDASIGNHISTCTSEYCVMATSLYNMNVDASKPLFLITDKGKVNWSSAALPTDTPFSKSIYMFNISCAQHTCAAVGYTTEHITQSDFAPLLYVSHDSAKTWEKTAINDEFILNNVKCKDNYCIAVGWQLATQHSVVLVSQDKGYSWIEKKLETPKDSHLILTDIDCTNNFCVIAGNEYHDEHPDTFLMYTSSDKGNSWNLIKHITNLPRLKSVMVTGLSCNEKNCLCTIEDGDHFVTLLPILLTSDNTGEKWQVISNVKNIPDGINAMFVDNIYHGQSSSNERNSSHQNARFKLSRSDRTGIFN